jgi:hypothetical protein
MSRIRKAAVLQAVVVPLLLWTLLPGTWELAENVSHLILDGHLAHTATPGHPGSEPGPEHGCSGTLHFCSCHASHYGLSPFRAPMPPLLGLTFGEPPSPVTEVLPGYVHPPDRPPSIRSI